jgi:hypothetical protein
MEVDIEKLKKKVFENLQKPNEYWKPFNFFVLLVHLKVLFLFLNMF